MAAARKAWMKRILLGLGLWLVYTANGREIGAGDTVPAILLPVGIVRGDGLALDRFTPVIRALDAAPAERFPPYFVALKHGRLVSRYPVATGILVLPLVAPQVALLDRARPGWDATPASTLWYGRWMAKNASAALAALAGVLLLEVLRRLGLGHVAVPATIVAALGSPLWVIAAQSPWHHGPAALLLTVAILLLLAGPRPPMLLAAGSALATMVACRIPTAVFALPLCGWALWRRPREAPWLLAPLAVGGVALITYNMTVFGTPVGGQSEIESARFALHDVPGSWGNLVDGIRGHPGESEPWAPDLLSLGGSREHRVAGDENGPHPTDRFSVAGRARCTPRRLREVLGLVGRVVLRAAILGGSGSGARHPVCARAGRDAGARALGNEVAARRRSAGRRRAGARRGVLSEHVEHDAPERRPPPRATLELAR